MLFPVPASTDPHLFHRDSVRHGAGFQQRATLWGPTTASSPQPPRLLEQGRLACQRCHYSPCTAETYVYWMRYRCAGKWRVSGCLDGLVCLLWGKLDHSGESLEWIESVSLPIWKAAVPPGFPASGRCPIQTGRRIPCEPTSATAIGPVWPNCLLGSIDRYRRTPVSQATNCRMDEAVLQQRDRSAVAGRTQATFLILSIWFPLRWNS